MTKVVLKEREKAAREAEEREHDIASGNPLLNPTKDFSVRRRYHFDRVSLKLLANTHAQMG